MDKQWWKETVIVGGVELTRLQLEVLRLNAQGLEYFEISQRLTCSLSYVQKILSRHNKQSALDKIGARNPREAILWIQRYDIQPNELGLVELKAIYQIGVHNRLEGRLELGLHLQHEITSLVDWFLKHRLIGSLESEFRYIKLLALHERIRAIQDEAPPPAIARTTALMDQALLQANGLSHKEPVGAAYLLKGDLLYVDGMYREALKYLYRAAELVTEIGHRLWLGRFILLCFAYLGEKKQFLALEPQVRDLIRTGQELGLDSSLGALEGLGRGQGLLGYDRSITTLYEEWNALARALALPETAFLRHTQVIRSRLDVAALLGLINNKSLPLDLLTGLRLAREGGYGRYSPILSPYSELFLDR